MQRLARDFFADMAAASNDAERIRRQLLDMERRALPVGSSSFELRVRGSHDPHKMEARVNAYVDRKEALRRRQDEDYAPIARASKLLYGPDEDGRGGLCAYLAPIHADVVWWRTMIDKTWKQLTAILDYLPSQMQLFQRTAYAVIDDEHLLEDLAVCHA